MSREGHSGAAKRLWVAALAVAVFAAVVLAAGCFNRPPTHGTELLIEADTSRLDGAKKQERVMTETLEALRKRVAGFGAKCSAQREETNRILIKVGVSTDPELGALKRWIERTGLLEFRLVHPESDALVKENPNEPGYEALKLKRTLHDGREILESVLVKKPPEMTGGIKRAMVVRGNLGEPEIAFTLNSQGAKRFAEITRDNMNRRLAIVLDGELCTAPVIRAPIENGAGQISGQFNPKEALELANLLEHPLEVPIKVLESRPF